MSRCIDEMAEDVKKQLRAHLQVDQFAHKIDEFTFRDNKAYIRFNTNEGPREEMLFARSLLTDIKGQKHL